MFINFVTIRDEYVVINIHYIMFIEKTKKGSRVTLSDGTIIDTVDNFNELSTKIAD